jgi:hypothetical protein
MESIAPGMPVRVIPNMLGKDDLEPASRRARRRIRSHSDKRVGWGGGIGHKGDPAILNEAMIALKDEVEWVFLGMDPDVPRARQDLAGMTMPQQYLAASLR